MKKIFLFTYLLLFHSLAFGDAPSANETSEWIVKYSSDHLKEGFYNDMKMFETNKITHGDNDCTIFHSESFFDKNDLDRSFDMHFQLDFERAITKMIMDPYSYSINLYGNVPFIVDKGGRKTNVDRDFHIVKFRSKESTERYVKAFRNLHNICEKIKKDLF